MHFYCFNSTLVQLKVTLQGKGIYPFIRFNSTLVQLKVANFLKEKGEKKVSILP